VLAERCARLFGTPHFIMGQTVIVALWIAANAVAFGLHWAPIPSSCSTSPSRHRRPYGASLILLAQTRQAERDKIRDTAVQEHRDAQVQDRETFEFQLGLMLDGDRKREAAHQALLDRQSTLIDEVACALHDVQASGTMQD
jgi:uncharacterized membrane protein